PTSLPALCSSRSSCHDRSPDAFRQQREHSGSPSTTVNDAFRAATRYWDRITHPAQVAQSLPLALETMLDPADCGPAFIGLPQDVQAAGYDYPARLFEPRLHALRRQPPDARSVDAPAPALRPAQRPPV